MTRLLFLVHRIPYPPNKGDKLRSFHLLKQLSEKFDIYLGAFVDQPDDWQYQNELEQYCHEIKLIELNPKNAKLRSLAGLLTNRALSLPYYHDKRMCDWVHQVVELNNIRHGLIYSSQMAQYIIDMKHLHVRVADFVDIDSDKWRQYAKQQSFPMSWIYARESVKLLNFEKEVANKLDKTLFVSSAEKKDFDLLSPSTSSKHDYYNNGVDYNYFDPTINNDNPFEKKQIPIVFTGAMDYWANIDAAKWFVNDIFPQIKALEKSAVFYIVGGNPAYDVSLLGKVNGVTVTGRVEDIRPYIKYAACIVAPMRIARGVQNKVLEAMAMAKPLVATSLAYNGVEQCDLYKPTIADESTEFAKQCLKSINSKISENYASRECIKINYSWEKNVNKVINILEELSGRECR